MKRTLSPALAFGLTTAIALPAAAQEVVVETPPPAVAEPPVIVIELVPAEPIAAPAPAPAVPATPASQYVVLTPQPIEQAPTAEPTAEAEAEDEPFDVMARPFSIGLSGLFGVRDGVDGQLEMTWASGLDLAYRVAPWARIAIRRVTAGGFDTPQGDRVAVGASPALDLSVPLGDVVEPFANLGVGVQARFGGRSPTFGLAPFVSAGARFHVIDWLSLGVEAAITVPATEHVLIGHELFPRASILVQLGMSIEARF